MFIDRLAELNTLTIEYQRPGSSLVIVYGRRRLGKTTLLKEFAKDKPVLYYLATEESEAENRKAFQRHLAEFTNNDLLRAAIVDDWELLFKVLADSSRKSKTVVVLDEFQYLGKVNPAFPSILQRIWDNILQHSNVMLILCGSLIHMMESQTLSYNSPLYGRRSAQIRLGQIPFAEYGGFYPGATEADLLPLYSITGGVPKYAELFQPQADLFDMITRHILSPSSFLYDEPNFLLHGEIQDVGSYFSIIKTIAAGEQKLGRIAASLGLPQTRLSQYLKTLANLDIVRREVPVTENHPKKSKRGLYRLQDNFLRFWFRFVYPYRSLLEIGQTQTVLDVVRRDLAAGHISWVYEDVCRSKAFELCSDGAWPLTLQKLGRWWDSRHEIDMVGIGEDAVLFGECKYWSKPVGLNVLRELQSEAAQVELQNPLVDRYYALFGASGFSADLEALSREDDHVLLSR